MGRGERLEITFRLEVEEVRDVATEYTIATLPGMSDEQIVVMTHTDGYFQAATDNAAGMASALELARFYAEQPLEDRPRDNEVHSVSPTTITGGRPAGATASVSTTPIPGTGRRETDHGAPGADAALHV